MSAKCPACNRQGQEIDFNIYKCKCGIEWTEPAHKGSLLPKKPGWFTRNRTNFKKLIQTTFFLIILVVAVAMTMKPVLVI